jgi:cell division protein FtsL
MDKILQRHIKKIRKYIFKEWLDEVVKAFEVYGEYKARKMVRNNKRLVRIYTEELNNEFVRLVWEETISNKKDIWK